MVAPKLRFKEFDKAFSRNTIKELAKIYVGRDLVEDAYSPVKTETHIYPIYSNSVDNEGLYGYYNFEEFNFDDDALTVVGRGAGLGKAFYRQGGFGTIGRLLSLTPKDKSFHPKYLSDYINDKLIIHNESGGIPQLPRSSLESYEVVLPSYEEQTKIASFLSAVDEKINQLTQKHQLLSQYKQGMMQKLFSQQIRFKADDGSEFGEWEENQLLDLSTKKSSKVTAKDIEDNDGDYIVFGASGHFRNINSYTESEPYIAIVKDGAGAGRLFLMPEKSSVLGTLEIVKPNLNIKLNFLFYRMQLIDFSSYIKGSTIPHVYFKDYSQEKIYLPCLEEQTKIANFLSAIDQKLEVVAQQIEQAKQWKKGLLQQMFV